MAKCSSLILLIWDVCSRYQAISVLDLPSSAILSSLHLSTQNLQPISDYQQYHYIRQSHSHSHITHAPILSAVSSLFPFSLFRNNILHSPLIWIFTIKKQTMPPQLFRNHFLEKKCRSGSKGALFC